MLHKVKIKWAIYLLSLLCCGIIYSCSIQKNHKSLSFFFDGVPYPVDSLIRQENVSLEDRIIDIPDKIIDSVDLNFRIVTYHEPYQFKGCDNCHNRSSVGKMIINEPDLCYQCHEDLSTIFPVLHGPVEGGFCTSCHNPHSSKEKYLLNDEASRLCTYCHNIDELSVMEEHVDGSELLCTSCHNPHGGEDRLMLRK